MSDLPYHVEVDDNGCDHCSQGRTWTVVGPDGIAEGVSYGDRESADDLADAMNRAYADKLAAAEARIAALQAEREELLISISNLDRVYQMAHARADVAEAQLAALQTAVAGIVQQMRGTLFNAAPLCSGETRLQTRAEGKQVQGWLDELEAALAPAKE